eukprot:359030-Chlamydomonas_euryale.AAC.3
MYNWGRGGQLSFAQGLLHVWTLCRWGRDSWVEVRGDCVLWGPPGVEPEGWVEVRGDCVLWGPSGVEPEGCSV